MDNSKRYCGQVTIPTVDNSEMGCEEFISSKCIYLIDTNIRVEDKPHPTLNDFLIDYDKFLYDFRRVQTAMRTEVQTLKNMVSDLETEVQRLTLKLNNRHVLR